MIAAILRAQWLSMRLGSRRGSIFGFITGILWYGVWSGVAIATGVSISRLTAEALQTWLPLGLLVVCAYWQLAPVLSASLGSSLDLRKLLLFPIPHHKLFQIEVLLRLATGFEMVLVLAGASVGLLVNRHAGGFFLLFRLLPALFLFVLFNLLFSSGLRSVLERLLTRPRVREVLVVLMTMLWILPRALVQFGVQSKALRNIGDRLQAVGYPWTATADVIDGKAVVAGLLVLVVWTLLAWWFGSTQFERSMRYDPLAAQATALPGRTDRPRLDRLYRLPSLFLSDPLAGLVEKELRALARTPRFRMVFVMGFTFGLMVWFPMSMGHKSESSAVSGYFLPVVCVYALTLLGQVSYWNCLGFDRSAAAFYYAAPPPFRTVLLGKNLASLCYIYLEVGILCTLTMAFGLARGWTSIAEALLVMGVCALYMLALGNLSSIHYPRGLHPERVSQGGASGRFQGLLFLLYPLALLPVGLAYLTRYALDSEFAFGVVLLIAGIMGGVFYWTAMQSAVATAVARREQIVQDLSRSDGPVVAD